MTIEKQRWPSGRQVAILILSGFILGLGGCFTFLGTFLGRHDLLAFLGAAVFIVGAILALTGVIAAIIWAIRKLRSQPTVG